MTFNDKGLSLLKSFEGCKLKAYQDIAGVWTCGYGATGPDIGPDTVWTQEQADERLEHDLNTRVHAIKALVAPPVSDNAFSALVCFAYNVGLHNLANSTLLKLVNGGAYSAAANQFLKWDMAGGVHVPGLLRRRIAERDLFLLA